MGDLVDELKALIIESLHLEELGPDDIDPNAPLFGAQGLDLDSVDALELAINVERRFAVRIDDDESSKEVMYSVTTLARHIDAKRDLG